MMNVFEVVKEAICRVQPGIDESRIAPGALLKEDLEIDSLGRVELALALEDAFGLILPDEELENIATVGDIVSLVEPKTEQRNA